MNPADENTLISQAQAGSLDSFNELVLIHQDQAFRLAQRILDDEEAAADAAQAGFLAAYRRLNSFRGGSFRAWLLQIVTNLCRDELRRRKRHPLIPLEPVNEDLEEIETPPWLADDHPTPEQMAEQSELARTIECALQALPEEFRTVLVLIDLEGLDYQEAAEVLHIPAGTVKSRLSRARMRMRDQLQSERANHAHPVGSIQFQYSLAL